MLLNENTIVLILKGRFAGRKAIIVANQPENKRCVVVGIERKPKSFEIKGSKNKFTRTFIKSISPEHLMITRYKNEIDFEGLDFTKALENQESKLKAKQELGKFFEKAESKNKDGWFFQKLTI